MFRRARFSVKPNVRPSAASRGSSGGGNSSGVPTAAPEAQHGPDTTVGSSESSSDSQLAAAEDPRQGRSSGGGSGDEKTSNPSGDGDHSKCTDSLLQRRKRISTMPNLAKPRVAPTSALRVTSSVSKCSQKQVSHSPPPSNSPLQKESPSCEKMSVEKSPILPEKKTPLPQVPQFSPFKKPVKETSLSVTTHKNDDTQQNSMSSPLKERPTQEILIQEELQQPKPAASKEKNTCSDHEKIIKAKKLRQLLKEELKKEKQQRKYKYPVIEKVIPEDRSKMVMRDFIYYLPENNPMTSSLVEEKRSEKTSAQAKEPEEKIVADPEDENEEAEEEEEQEDDGPLLVPRVKVAEDGSIILDEESLTVEVLRTKGQCVVEENDPIFERGSTTTYSSFRKSYYTKPWSEKETEMFFLAISMVGTDFSMISQLFPHRARTEIKNKFKREEKANGWRIDKAFKEKRPFDFDVFTKLLEKVLENERRKNAKCQHQKEKTTNEKKVLKSQKKKKAKVTNGQPSLGQDDQNAQISDAEMEADCGTAEKENEESLSILEQTEGQIVTESVGTKKKRKKKKKDSEQEAESLSEGKNIPSESVEEERLRKERKSISSNVENNDAIGELEVSDGQTLEESLLPVEEDPQCCKQLNEGAEGENNLISFSIQDGAIVEDESELQVSEGSSEHLAGQLSESLISTNSNEERSEGPHTETDEVVDLIKLDEDHSVPPGLNDKAESVETERSATEKFPIRGQLQRLIPNLTGNLEKCERLVNTALEDRLSPSEPMHDVEKTVVEDKAAKVIGSTTEELTEKSNDVGRESQETREALEEKMETRGRRQRPKPNLIKATCRKEALIQGTSECQMLCIEPDGTVRKNIDQEAAGDAISGEATEKDFQSFTGESLTCEKSNLQENSKLTVLKPTPLARGRMKKPKPNLGTVAKRQALPPRKSEAREEKVTDAAVETQKTLMQDECRGSDLLTTHTTEAGSYEAHAPRLEDLENKVLATPNEVDLIHSIQPSVKKPLECASFELKKTPLSDCVEDVSELVSRHSSCEEIQKEKASEIKHWLESFCHTLEENLGEPAERKEASGPEKEMLEANHLTGSAEKKTVHISSECGKLSDLDEGAKCGSLPSSHSSEERSTDVQEAVEPPATLPSPQNISTLDNDDPNDVSLSRDVQEKSLVSKLSTEGEGKQSAIQPVPLLRGRLQRPKPNVGRAAGRKEAQTAEKNGATVALLETEKSEPQKSEPAGTPSVALQLKLDNRVLPAETSEDRLLDCEKMAHEDSQVPGTSQNISELRAMRKALPQEDKPCTIKPAQLMRGRLQRARPNLGRLNGKRREPLTEIISAPIDRENEKLEMETLKKSDDLYPLSTDEADVRTPLGDLEKPVNPSVSSETIMPERCIDQIIPEMSESCEFLKDQVKMCLSKDFGKKQLDTLASGVSTAQEVQTSTSVTPTQLVRSPLQRPKPNLARGARKKEVSSERSTEDEAGEISLLLHDFGEQVGATSSTGSWRQKNCADNIKQEDSKRCKHSEICESPEQSLIGENQIRKEVSSSLSVQEGTSGTQKRKQPQRTLKQTRPIHDSRPSYSASECETDHSEKGKRFQKVKPNVSRGRRFKQAVGKKPRKEYASSKVNLVTLRASSQEEEEDDDDVDDFEPDYEAECFSPEEVNKAPVFVPKGLRSLSSVSVQIEETMEELEIYENIPEEVCVTGAECLSYEQNIGSTPAVYGDKDLHTSQLVITQEKTEKEKGLNDDSTEVAMTLLAMRDPAFQLNISSQENTQNYPDQDGQIVAESFLHKYTEERSVLDSNLSAPSKHELVAFTNASETSSGDPSTGQSDLEGYLTVATNVILPGPSKNEGISSHSLNKAAVVDHNLLSLEECSQEVSRVCSDGPSSKGNKISKPARCRFPKPKPNLGRSLGKNRSAFQKRMSVGVEQSNQTQNEENVAQSTVENQKAELEQNLTLEELPERSSADKYDFQLGKSSHSIQEKNTEWENLVKQALQVTSVLAAPDPSPRIETQPSELPNDSSLKINVQLHEQDSGSFEHHLSTGIAQTEESKHPGSSVDTEMTAGVKECPEAEQTFILTLVEIPVDSEACSGASASLQQACEGLLPAPVFCTSDSMELTRNDSSGFVKATPEENTVSLDDITETGELQTTSTEKPVDCGSVFLKDLKRHAQDLEGSCNPPPRKKTSTLKSSNKEISLKSVSLARKTAGKSSEKLIISEKENSTTSRSTPELTEPHMKEKQTPQSSLLVCATPNTDEPVSRTFHSGKAENSEARRSCASIHQPVPSGQTGSTAFLPKIPPSRLYPRSLGFLPLVCKKINTKEVTTKRNKQSSKKPHTDVSKGIPECPNLNSRNIKDDIQGNSSVPSIVSASSKCETVSSSTAQVFSMLCKNESSSKEQEKDEEPTRISEYFFNDIFMEVDDSE